MGVSPNHGQDTAKVSDRPILGGLNSALTCSFVEPMTGIEPAYSAWEADVLPLNYIGMVALTCGNAVQRAWGRASLSHDVTTPSKLVPASCSAANCE